MKKNETGNGYNSCWINACLYLFLAHQQVIDKCKKLDFPNDEKYNDLINIHQEFLKLRDNSVGENNESDPYWNETFYLKVKNYIKNYGDSYFNINSKYYSEQDKDQYSKFLANSPNDYNDLKLSLVYIFPLMIKYNFQQLDLIIFNSGELCYGDLFIKPCNLFNFLFSNHLYFLGNNDKKLTLEIPLMIQYSENNTLFDILTNKFTLKKEENALTQQLFGNYDDFGTYECVGFVISRYFLEGNNTNVGHYVTYVKTGNSSKNTWIRWDALEINKVATQGKVQKVFEIKTVNDIDDIYKYEFVYSRNPNESEQVIEKNT